MREMEGSLKGGNWVEPTIVLMKTGKEQVMMKESFVPSQFKKKNPPSFWRLKTP